MDMGVKLEVVDNLQRKTIAAPVSVAPPNKLVLQYGDTVRISIRFEYQGPSGTVKIHGAIGTKGWAGFDEVLMNERVIDVPNSPTTYAVVNGYVDITVGSSIEAGTDYDLYAKINEHPSIADTVEDCIDITGLKPTYSLVYEKDYPFAWLYKGEAQGMIAEYRISPFDGSVLKGEEFAAALRDQIIAQGGHILSVKAYADISPLLWTDIRVEIEYVPPETIAGRISFAWVPVIQIVILALAAIGITVALTLLIKEVVRIFNPKPDLEAAKQGWSKPTMIDAIQEMQEYYNLPVTPNEQLEAMSETEVRDYLDEVAEENVPMGTNWLPVVLIAGGALVLFGLTRKTESGERGYQVVQRKAGEAKKLIVGKKEEKA